MAAHPPFPFRSRPPSLLPRCHEGRSPSHVRHQEEPPRLDWCCTRPGRALPSLSASMSHTIAMRIPVTGMLSPTARPPSATAGSSITEGCLSVEVSAKRLAARTLVVFGEAVCAIHTHTTPPSSPSVLAHVGLPSLNFEADRMRTGLSASADPAQDQLAGEQQQGSPPYAAFSLFCLAQFCDE